MIVLLEQVMKVNPAEGLPLTTSMQKEKKKPTSFGLNHIYPEFPGSIVPAHPPAAASGEGEGKRER